MAQLKDLISKFTLQEWETNKHQYQPDNYKVSIDGWNNYVYVYKIK